MAEAKQLPQAPRRVLDHLRRLMEAFHREAFVCSTIRHVLIGLNDDLTADALYGEGGFLRPDGRGGDAIPTPREGPQLTIAYQGKAVLQAPEWTEKGRAMGLEPMTFNWLPEARKVLIATPGVVVDGYLTADHLDAEITHRHRRFTSLARDAVRCLEPLRGLPQFADLDLADRLNAGRWGTDADFRWMRLVHRMGWAASPTALGTARRFTWLPGGGPTSVTFLPYDERQLRALLEHAAGFLARAKDRVAVPPDRFLSVLDHDAFTASAHAIDELVARAAADPAAEDLVMPQPEPSPPERPREKVFVSYSHKDARWLDEFTTMLAPAIRARVVDVWYDRKIKPGDVWRKEIDQALESARIGLLLVTEHFLESRFIAETELPYLVERAAVGGVKLLWVAVAPCLHEHTPLTELQALNDPDKPLSTFTKSKRAEQLQAICRRVVEHYGTVAAGPE